MRIIMWIILANISQENYSTWAAKNGTVYQHLLGRPGGAFLLWNILGIDWIRYFIRINSSESYSFDCRVNPDKGVSEYVTTLILLLLTFFGEMGQDNT